MKSTQSVIILLAVILVAVIGYSFYLHQGPLKNIFNENQNLKNEIARLNSASEKIKADYESDITAKIRFVEKLQQKNIELEQSVEEIRKEKETAGTDFQEKIESLEKLRAQYDRELQISHGENLQLRTAETALQDQVQSLENQLAKRRPRRKPPRRKTNSCGQPKRHFRIRFTAWKTSSPKKRPRR